MNLKQAAVPLRSGLQMQSRVQPSAVDPSIGTCIAATYDNGKICADIPLIGQQCLSFPGLPSGQGSAQVCANYKFPFGVEVCASVLGHKVGCVTL